MSPSEPPEPSSPSCLAHEADDTYMGYASRAEILSFLEEIQAIAPATTQSLLRIREMLPRIRDDVLYRELAELAKRLESREIAPG